MLALLAFAVYWPAIGGGFIWDDLDYVAQNLAIRSLHGLWQIWTQPSASPQYYPLVFSGFWLEYHIWGLHTFGYHAVNLLLHVGSAMLIWRIMDDLKLPGGWLAAAIFALHPVHVESVAWISECKNVLSTFFYLLALRVYLQPFTRRRWSIALALFVAAMLSKSVTATWPAAMLVIFWWRNRSIVRHDIVRLLPFFALAILGGLLTAHIEHTSVGANAAQYAELKFSIADRILIAGRAICFYAAKLILPWPLAFIYPRWILDPRAAWQWLFPLIAIASVLLPLPVLGGRAFTLLFRKKPPKKEKPSPQLSPRLQAEGGVARALLAAMLLFIGTLFPALGFINVYPMRYSFVADHFQYLASIALIVPIAALSFRFLRNASALVLLPLAILTSMRAGTFAGPLPLWSDTYAKNPNSWMVCTNLANTLNKLGQTGAARGLFLRAYELSPQLFETQTNAALVFAQQGQTQRAIDLLESSARLNPDFPVTFFNWGQVLENSGDPAGAITKYQRAADLAPEFPAPRQRLLALEAELHHASTQRSRDTPRQ